MLFCEDCGDPMRGIAAQRPRKTYRYYLCESTKHRGRKRRRAVAQPALDHALLTALRARLRPAIATPSDRAALRQAIERRLAQGTRKDARSEARRLVDVIRKLTSMLDSDDRRLRRRSSSR